MVTYSLIFNSRTIPTLYPDLNTSYRPSHTSISYIQWTLEFFVQLRKVFPLNQNKTPKRHHNVINIIFVMIAGTYPSLTVHGVTSLESPYPQRFLLMVMATKIEPATGLYESTAYVEDMAGRAATWIPAQVKPIMTVI